MYEKLKDFQCSLVSIIVLIALIICTGIIATTIKKETISVTGSAFKIVESDTAVLRLTINSKNANKSAAYNVIKSQIPTVKTYLISNGINESEITISAPSSYPTYKTNAQGYSTNIVDEYNFSQNIEIKSNDVNKIKELSISAQSLLDKGIDLSIDSPEYYYSKLSEIKVELLKEASEDAKQRAKGMLSATNNRVGKISSVKMGVFQITPADSTDVTDSGMNDTTSIKKKVNAVANVSFGIK